MRLLGMVVAAVAVLILGAARGYGQEAGGWVGQRVVTKMGAVLKVGRQGVAEPKQEARPGGGDRGDFRIYRVEKVSGPWLSVVAENEGVRGWIPVEQVVPIDRAIDYFTSAIRANPADRSAYLRRAATWHVKEEYDKAIGDFNEAIRLQPKDARAYIARGDAWLEKGQFVKALADAEEAIRLEPKDTQGYVARGKFGRSKRAADKASADARAAIELVPKDSPAQKAQAGGAEPVKPGAAPAGSAAESGSPGGPGSDGQRRLAGPDEYNGRGEAWQQKREFDKAIADYSEAIRLDPTFATAYNNRGLVWLDKKAYDQALTDFNEALQLNPGHPAAHNNRGLAWYEKREYDKAVVDFNEAIRLRPGLGPAHSNRGLAWFEKREYEKARVDFNDAIGFDGKDALAYNNRAWLSASCPDARFRDGKRAVESATYACKLTDWKEANYVGTLAAAYAEAGDFDAAVKWQTKAQELYTDKTDRREGSERLALYRARKPYRVVVDKK